MSTEVWWLLECLGFVGILFGWVSLVFVFKTEHHFEELCEPNARLTGNTALMSMPWDRLVRE